MLYIPLDNRPVCYDMPQQVAKIAGVNLAMPPKEILGGLTYQADFDALRDWTFNALKQNRVSSAVIALDTIAYGGLVPSRWSEDYYDDIIGRINQFLHLFKSKNINVYAFSSIMRISNNNSNEEEKEYWSEYGKLIYQYSNLFHKAQKLDTPHVQEQLANVLQEIPEEILEDFISARERNFEINQYYVEKLKQGHFEQLVFCQDDTAKWGINVLEADTLRNLIMQTKVQNKALIHPGTDEIATCLVFRAHLWPNTISVYPIYTQEDGKEILANYEDRPIKKSIEGQIKLCGAKKSNSIGSADLVLLAHVPEIFQGDYIFDEEPEGFSDNALSKGMGLLQSLNKPIAVADMLWANGADPQLVGKILDSETNIDNLYSYAGWNTASNSIGSALAIGLMKVVAENEKTINNVAHKKMMVTRFVDDWCYQADVRQTLSEPDVAELNQRMLKAMKPVTDKFQYEGEIEFDFPWERLFEVETIFK